MKKIAFFAALLCCYLSSPVVGQQTIATTALNTWFQNTVQMDLNSKWSTLFEFHERTAEPFATRSVLMIRPALEYSLKPQLKFTLGYSLARGFAYAPFGPDEELIENNIWEQVALSKRKETWFIGARLRFEHRWIKPKNEGVNFNHRLRFRVLLRKDFPLKNGFEVIAHLYDEFFFRQNEYLIPEAWSANRLALGLGWGYKKRAEMLFNYQYQTNFLTGDLIVHRPTFWLTVLSKFSLQKKKKTEAAPVQGDSF